MTNMLPRVFAAAIAVGLAIAASPASAQTQQQKDWCYKEGFTDDQTATALLWGYLPICDTARQLCA